ncbi:FAD-dependent monooxygenase [Ideonella sp. DXS29W]|uniref:FAD-dependent monooxygenase n=1 Tax=Ideonella lacteola TaxID=2984193 RepID=A0ABU9BIZ6_9BURK
MALNIAIVGAGLAGLAAAVAVTSAGAQADVFDCQAALAAPPVHLDVVPALFRDLVLLGLGEPCVRQGFPYYGTAVVDAEGRPRFEMPTPQLAGTRWPAAVGMGYATLLRVLHDAAVAQGARVHWRSTITAVDAAARHCRLVTQEGSTWQCDFALLAGARGVDGIALPLATPAAPLTQRWDHVLLPRPQGLDRSTWIVGPGRHKALVVPTGPAEAGIAVLREAQAERTPEALRAHLSAQGPWLAAAAAHIRNEAPVVARPVHSGLLAGDWYQGTVLRIGSSAHLLPPHFGQAAAQAVEDATVLQQLLCLGLAPDALFEQFMQRRAARAARVHAVCTQAARWDLHPEPSTDLAALARELAPIVEQRA